MITVMLRSTYALTANSTSLWKLCAPAAMPHTATKSASNKTKRTTISIALFSREKRARQNRTFPKHK